MKKQQRQIALKVVLFLSLIGVITSIYLTINHYASPSKGSICDFGESVSCSLVNTSVYSELFNVPVALFGALWFVILIAICWYALKKTDYCKCILLWSIPGVLFIMYMIIAEIILKSLCPFCTLVHIIVIAVFIIAIKLEKSSKKMTTAQKASFIRDVKKWLVVIGIIYLIPLIIFNLPQGEQVNYDTAAKCITEKGVNMYGSFRCGVCARTRAMFGDSFQYINEIECHPQGENPQTKLCLEKQLQGTPTWILEPNGEELKREVGFLTVDELKQFAGCE